MRVLGIDPGSETLGWGVVEGEGLKYRLVGFRHGQIFAEREFFQACFENRKRCRRSYRKISARCHLGRRSVFCNERKGRSKTRTSARRSSVSRRESRVSKSPNTVRASSNKRSSATAMPKNIRCKKWSCTPQNENRASTARRGGRTRQRHLSLSSRRSAKQNQQGDFEKIVSKNRIAYHFSSNEFADRK